MPRLMVPVIEYAVSGLRVGDSHFIDIAMFLLLGVSSNLCTVQSTETCRYSRFFVSQTLFPYAH
jgi:hypothetical protein